MTYATRTQKQVIEGGTIFTIKVRPGPEYEGHENDLLVHAMTEEGAAIEALVAAYNSETVDATEAPDFSDEVAGPDTQGQDDTAPDSSDEDAKCDPVFGAGQAAI